MALSTIKNYRWIVVALLFFATTINYLDRQIIGLLKPFLEKEFHLHPCQFDDIVIIERVCLRVQCFAVDDGKAGAFDMRDEVTLRTARDDGNLHAGFAQGGQILGEFEFPARACTVQYLYCWS